MFVTPRTHGHLYEYALLKPIQDSKFSDSAYRGFRYIPNSCSGLRWSLVDELSSDVSSKGGLVQKQLDGFYGWRGLVPHDKGDLLMKTCQISVWRNLRQLNRCCLAKKFTCRVVRMTAGSRDKDQGDQCVRESSE